MITAYFQGAAPDVDTVLESDEKLLFQPGVSIARGIPSFKQRQSYVLVTNLTAEYQYYTKGAAIAFLEETQEASDVIAVADFESSREDSFQLPHPFEVNPVLPKY